MKVCSNVVIFNHPLIAHKIAILRDRATGTKEFRELVEEITALMTYESIKDVPTKKITVGTPLEDCEQSVIVDDSIAIVPILRAGLGMVSGFLSLYPTAKVGHIGMARNEETLRPEAYYYKLPEGIENMQVILLDPMLATGGSAVAAIQFLKDKGVKNISLMNIIAAPEGMNKVSAAHPDVKVFIACLDRELNKNGYILPGLGDAGDRMFGTK